ERMPGQLCQVFEILLADFAVDTDAGDVIDDHGHVRILGAHRIDLREIIRIDQRADHQSALTGVPPHGADALAVPPAFGASFSGTDAKAAHAELLQTVHLPFG